jgi:nucleoid-associated protein YgaU
MADRLEQLKQKYGPVLRVIEQQQVRLQNVHMEGDKLLIRGEAPSQDAKNQVWDQIKLVDPQWGDLIADITVQSGGEQTATAAAGEAKAGDSHTYMVKPGDTLSGIAKQVYGNASQYMKIFEANRNILSDPNKIKPGQELVIP